MSEQWHRCALRELCDFAGGYGFPPHLQGNINGTIPFIKVSDMNLSKNQRFIASANNHVEEQTAFSQGWKPFPAGAVVFAKVGAALLLNRRRILTQPTLIDNNMMAAIPTEELDSLFLYHLLTSIDFKIFVQDGVVPSVNQAQVGSVIVPCIALAEQRRIAEVLDSADAEIQAAEETVAKLKEAKAGLLHDLLTRGLDAAGGLRDPIAHPEQFRGTELGLLPREWEVVYLGEHIGVFGGKRLPTGHSYADTSTGFRYLRVTDFFDRPIDFAALMHLHADTFLALRRYEIHSGQLYISIAGSLGFVGVYRPPYSDRTILTENAARLVPSDTFIPEYLAYLMNSQFVQHQIEAEKGTGGGVPKLALFRIEGLSLLKPSIEEQSQIVATLTTHDARIRAEEERLAKLRAAKQGIMDDLLTGRVRVGEGAP